MRPHGHAVQLPYQPPLSAFLRTFHHEGVVWLDSSRARPDDGRYSILACEPASRLSLEAGRWMLHDQDGASGQGSLDFWPQFERFVAQRQVTAPADAGGLPFYGGAIGWLSYDLGRNFESLHGSAVQDLAVPDLSLAWYDAALVWDHAEERLWLVGTGSDAVATAAMNRLRLTIEGPPVAFPNRFPENTGRATGNLSRAEYMSRVELIRAGIARGEFYQLNLVRRLACRQTSSPAETYLRLRSLNPAPFSCYLESPSLAILCSSPERFLEVSPTGGIRTCPIKGTRPRGVTEAEDAILRRELIESAKERAELLMIVDLLRNDLGRICVNGSVTVTRLHALESFATVHHLVGEVRGQLRPGLSRHELLRAVFPGGSITGAPKVSAMRAIDQLEPHRRGVGMGSIGYFSAHGRIDLNIAIRTIIMQAGMAYVPVGAGIVWDSDPAQEYEETMAKAQASLAALGVTEVLP